MKAWDDPKATIIPAKTWVVRAQWYLSTSENPRDKRQAYKLLPGKVLVKVSTIIQEMDHEFRHEGRAGSAADGIRHVTMRDSPTAAVSLALALPPYSVSVGRIVRCESAPVITL
eukprot:2014982-Prymnesium_polylepis.1